MTVMQIGERCQAKTKIYRISFLVRRLLVGVALIVCTSFTLAIMDNSCSATSSTAIAEGVGDTNQVELPMVAVQQNPELPTGCEAVALTNVLLSYGFELDKTTIADAWMPRSETDFVNAFMGNPYDSLSNSCMAPCVAQTANDYLEENGSELHAYDETGATFREVLGCVAEGHPVIIWSTIGFAAAEGKYATQWSNGRQYNLFENSHCVVVYGYDSEADTVMISDSLEGYITCSIQTVVLRYKELGSQAVVIR